MLIDLHTHEKLFSPCSCMSLEEAVAAARARGLDGICITSHDSMEIKSAAACFLRECDFPVFVGVEVRTQEGDIVAFGLETLPQKGPTAQEFVDFVNAQNGFCFAAHPYRSYGSSPCLGDEIFALRGLHGVEVINGMNNKIDNHKALLACERLGLIPVGGSDAHDPEGVGSSATLLPMSVTTVRELVEILKSGKCRAVKRDTAGRFGTEY